MNRFAILESVDSEDISVHSMVEVAEDNAKMVEKDFCVEPRKLRAASAGVKELMKTLKPKKKGPVDKGKSRQVKAGALASRCSTSTT